MRVKEAFASVTEEIRTITHRAAMGLPDSYVLPEALSLDGAAAHVYGQDSAALVSTLEDPSRPLEHRLTAGLLLGILGDPRVQTFEPEMVQIPGGEIFVGLPWESVGELVSIYHHQGVKRSWIEKECPRHSVQLKPYAIAKYPVTNAEYSRFLSETTWREIPTSWAFGRFHPGFSNHPVYSVTPEAADAYVAWLSKKTSRRFRLPSEAEWEFAAAGPEGRTFPWGEFTQDRANTLESGLLMATAVGIFPRGVSCFGVHDMAGNVEELTASNYAPYPSGSPVDDDLAEQGTYRVCRGGAFTRFRDLARCQRRHGTVDSPLYPVSFRIAEDR
jgi:toxoflavin biosynthesis protein ToxD